MSHKGLQNSASFPSTVSRPQVSEFSHDTIPDWSLLIRLIAQGEVPFDSQMPEPLRSELASEVRQERKRQLIRLLARLMAYRLHAARREEPKA